MTRIKLYCLVKGSADIKIFRLTFILKVFADNICGLIDGPSPIAQSVAYGT